MASDASTKARCLVPGSINIDEFFTVEDIVRPGQTISSTSFERRAGGKGANQAVAVARAGGLVDLSGAVGVDGRWVVQYLKDVGVGVNKIVEVSEPTGRAIIQLAASGENSIVLLKGANHTLLPPPDPSTLTATPAPTHVLLQNEIPLPTTLAYLAHAHERGLTTLFNPSPLPSVPALLAFPWSTVSWLLVNESEARALLDTLGAPPIPGAPPAALHGPDTPPSIMTAYTTLVRLHTHPLFSASTGLVCTLGAAGVLALLPASASTSVLTPLYQPAAPLRGPVRDTTGAGDCLAGYFVRGLMDVAETGRALDEAALKAILERCVKAAGICVERRGAMESIPSAAEVDAR